MGQQYGCYLRKDDCRDGRKEYTLQQAAKFLESHDRSVREEVYRKIQGRRLQDKKTFDELFSQLVRKRHQVY